MALMLKQLGKRKFLLASAISAVLLTGCGGGDSEDSSNDNPEDQRAPDVSVSDVSIREGNGGDTTVVIQVELSGRADNDVQVSYETSPGTASAGADFKNAQGSLTIRRGSSRQSLDLTINGDTSFEEDEWFELTLSSAQNANLSNRDKTARITIENDDEKPFVYFTVGEQAVSETVGSADITLALDTVSGFDTEVDLDITGTAQEQDDYNYSGQSRVVIPAGSLSETINVDIVSDAIPEGGETIIFDTTTIGNGQAPDPDGNLSAKHTIIISGDVALNDTGVTTFSDGAYANGVSSEPASAPMQDASVGRDVSDPSSADGHAGFSYTKLDPNGNPLPASAAQWSCVRDNVTGLVWEEKTPTTNPPVAGVWRADNYEYKWFEDDASINGGNQGDISNPKLKDEDPVSADCAYVGGQFGKDRPHGAYCNIQSYTFEANYDGLCGFDNWRIPAISELRSIYVYASDTDASLPDPTFFSNTAMGAGKAYLSSTPSADSDASAWCVDAVTGDVELCKKDFPQHVRIVRSPEGSAQ